MSPRAANPPVPAATDPALIRNFCIIAHIDHGKSTLADRMLGITGVVSDRDMRAQYLDRMDIERERGITIKSQAVRMPWQVGDTSYALNMIDTPGHVDFSYEVSRSLAACEGAILLVDAAQGIEAQTLANLYLALENDLEIIPVLNKIDLPAAEPEKYAKELADLIGGSPDDVLKVSGKTGVGVEELLDRVVERIPAPVGDADAPARAMIFDSVYDSYRGVVTYVRMVDGHLNPRERIQMMSTRATHEILEIGVSAPEPTPTKGLGVGEVGYLITGVKDVRQSKVGDTVTTAAKSGHRGAARLHRAAADGVLGSLPDRRQRLPRAARGARQAEAVGCRARLRARDLGRPRLRLPRRLPRPAAPRDRHRAPAPRVRARHHQHRAVGRLRGHDRRQEDRHGHEPERVPDGGEDLRGARAHGARRHPRAQGLRRHDHGALPVAPRHLLGMEYLGEDRVEIRYNMPLGEIVFDFFDQLKSKTAGYASLDYEPTGDQAADLVKVDILLQGEQVDAFSAIVHRDKAYAYGVLMTGRLRELIPRQQFEVPIQAAIGARIIARESIRAMRKDVLAKCYGGDITRKRKLLEKQKEGKKRMKMVGRVEVPQEAFIAALSGDTEKKDAKKK